MECGSYKGIKLLEHAMKVVDRIFEYKIWQQIDIDDMQFGFMKGRGTTDAIFIVRQMQENFRAKEKKLCFGFVDLEKAFDRVPREVAAALKKLKRHKAPGLLGLVAEMIQVTAHRGYWNSVDIGFI